MARRSMLARWELLPSRLEVSPDARALVMLRVAAALVAVSQLAFAVPALLDHPETASLAAFIYCFNICLGLLFVQLTFHRWMLAVWRAVTVFGCICLLASAGSLSLLNGEAELYFISGFLLVLGAGALLPWETKWQDSLACASLLGLGALALLGRNDALSIFHWVGMGTAAAVGHFAASLGQQNRNQVTQQNLRLADNEAALRRALDSILDPGLHHRSPYPALNQRQRGIPGCDRLHPRRSDRQALARAQYLV